MRNSLGGLPKRAQTFLFFTIDPKRIQEFRTQLKKFVPQITTLAKVKDDRDAIEKSKAAAKNSTAPILSITGVNISFTKKGLTQVRAFCLLFFRP